MRIVNIVPQPVCHGPIDYLVVWDCPHCNQRNHFGRRVSLLPPEDRTCTGCRTVVRYRFPEDYFKNCTADLEGSVAMDEAAQAALLKEHDPDLSALGHNLIYALSAKLASNIRRFPL